MTKFLISFCILIGLSACTTDVEPGSESLLVYKQASLQDGYPYVTSGNAWVFHYFKAEPQDPTIYDDEFSEDLFLEIHETGDSFSYTNEDDPLIDIPLIYRQNCFCSGFNVATMSVTKLIGTRQTTDDWILEADITLHLSYVSNGQIVNEWTRDIQLNGRFLKAEFLPK